MIFGAFFHDFGMFPWLPYSQKMNFMGKTTMILQSPCSVDNFDIHMLACQNHPEGAMGYGNW